MSTIINSADQRQIPALYVIHFVLSAMAVIVNCEIVRSNTEGFNV
jgi:hypothetical protein